MRNGLVVDSAKDDTDEIARVWHKCEEESAKVSQAEFDKKHAALLRDLVCAAKESRDVITKGIIRIWISSAEDRRTFLTHFALELRGEVSDADRRAFSAQLARGLLGEDGKPCAATKDLDAADKEKLRAAIARAPSAPAPTAPAPSAAAAPTPSAAAAPPPAAPAPVAAPAASATPAPAPSQPK